MGIKRNFAYNSLLKLSQYIISFLMFPYTSRVLGVENIGKISFVDNTINYFILFSTLGIATIGSREIAKYRNDKKQLSAIYSSLIVLSLCFTFIVLLIYFVLVIFVPQFYLYKSFFIIGTAKILFAVILVEWFFTGIEQFKFISIRNFIIQLIYAGSILLFVKNKDDYMIFFILTVLSVVINSLTNIYFSRNQVQFSLRYVKLKGYFKQSMVLGSYTILTSMYTTFNIMYLGIVAEPKEVGFYSTALKIYIIVLGFFSAFTSVMMPRMSFLLHEGDNEAFKDLISKSFEILFTICFPLVVGTVFLAPQIIGLISGKGYEGAITPMRIIMPLILIVGIAQIIAVQVLMPMHKDKIVFTASVVGALIGVSMNLILVHKFGAIGTAIVILISETMVTVYYIFCVTKEKILKFPLHLFLKKAGNTIPYLIICALALFFSNKSAVVIAISFGSSIIYFIISEVYLFQNDIIINLLNKVKNFKLKLF